MTENQSTPAAEWREKGEADPHGNQYDCERAALTLGTMTDDELANEAFLNYDRRPSIQDLLDGKGFMPIVWMTAVKERIRWLSRALSAKADAAAGVNGTVKIYETYTGQNGWIEVTQEEYDRTKDKYEHRIRRVTAPPPASTNRLTDDSVAQWQWRWKGDEEWRNSDEENCAIASANTQGLFEVRALYVAAPPASAPKLTDDQWEELRRIARTYNEKGFPKYAREFFDRAIIAATEAK